MWSPPIDPPARPGRARYALALAVLVLGGCQPGREPLGQVTGRVTFQGQPVSKGLVVFSNAEKGVHIIAELRDDGTYAVQTAGGHGLPLGTYRIAVNPPLPDLPPVGPLAAEGRIKEYPNIPKKYRDPRTSGLTLDVTEKGCVFDVNMEP